ncbi:MAG: penicillin acylase family protein, partial [Proteobacteria bacterium]|nr:penicillin acylase family protein [Pseudomonadota bacterium]
SYLTDRTLHIGSNNWTVAPRFSASGKPIVANDPHLAIGLLPGPWYPSGLITPQGRAVGVTIPGMPGMVVGRTDHVSLGVTNAYGDTQDLYVETVDPDDPNRYLEGDRSLPFEIIEEKLLIKDGEAPNGFREEQIIVRLTKRGPVVSEVLSNLKTEKVITVRWSIFESMQPSLGLMGLLDAKTVFDVRKSLGNVTASMLNFVFADTAGNIGWQTTGRIPIRNRGDGLVPYTVKDGQDNWSRWIPYEEMPQGYNPARGWLGTCNHKTVKNDYAYYYSSHFSPSYRYQRLKELLTNPGKTTPDHHWEFQRDTLNLMAKQIAPIMAQVLSKYDDTQTMGRILSQWNFHDDPDQAAPAVFQAVYREFAILVFEDELGEDLAKTMLDTWYFWQERLGAMVAEGSSPWFDRTDTRKRKENLNNMFHQAALNAMENMSSEFGEKPRDWQWGKVHQVEFVSPLRRKGFGKELLGAGTHSAPGSQEVLNRGMYKFSEPYDVLISASLRMVADLGDDDKILAVLPGGVSGRFLNPHLKDQVEPFMNGQKLYWWFSDKAIKAHRRVTLTFRP